MKPLYALLCAIFLTTAATQAAVLTVNNNNPSPGQYATFAAAQTAASPGDTLYISGSPYNYNTIYIAKRLTIIGTGHKPVGDFPQVSKFDDVHFTGANTSLYDVNIIGLDVNYLEFDVANTRRAYVSRCRIRDRMYFSTDMDSVTIEGNFFEASGDNIHAYTSGRNYTNITVKNNVFNGHIRDFYPNSSTSNDYLDNNLFLTADYLFYGSNRYLQFRNNIFYRADPNGGSPSYISFDNNIIYQAYSTNAFPTSSGNTATNNQNNVNPLFVNFPAAGDYYAYTYDFNLQSASPARNAGTDGKDIGLTGGSGYFQKGGIPPIPQVNQFSITTPANATIAPGGTLQISVLSTISR